jgi:hypothetical protein
METASLLEIFEQSHHGFWWEVFSLASAGLAIALLAYRKHRLRRLFPLSIAFGLFVLKVGLLHLDSIYPMLQSELEVSSVAVEVGMLSMIFLAFIRK